MAQSFSSENVGSRSSNTYLYGLVGGIFPDPREPGASLVISSPNMLSIPNPLVHVQRAIRQYSNGGFGVDDFTLHPQVFRQSQVHLPLILAPRFDQPGSGRAIIHQPLDRDAWEESYTRATYGIIKTSYASAMEGKVQELAKRFERAVDMAALSGSADASILATRKGLIRSLKNRVGRFTIPNTYEDLVVLWAACQRLYHDILSFMDWFEVYREIFKDIPTIPRPVDTERLGAITSSYEDAEALYKAGLPTYFIRPAPAVDLSRDIKYLLPTHTMNSLLSQTSIVAINHQYGTSSAKVLINPQVSKPSCPVLFRGKAKSPHRAAAMNLWMQMAHPLQRARRDWTAQDITRLKEFGVFDPTVHILPSDEPAPSITTPSSSTARTSSQRGNAKSNALLPAKATTKAAAPSGPSKWANQSRLMPPRLMIWSNALEDAGHNFNPSAPPTWPSAAKSKTDWRGYALPDPNFISNMSNPETRDHCLRTYVHHRAALLFRVEHLLDCAIKASNWRTNMLAGYLEIKPGSSNAKALEMAHEEVNSSLRMLGYKDTVDFRAPQDDMKWQGAYMMRKERLSLSTTRSILSELNEIQWRWELCRLDWVLLDRVRVLSQDESAVNDKDLGAQRRQHVLTAITHFDRSLVPAALFYKSQQGFASRNTTTRAKALNELAGVMDEWQEEWRVDGAVLRQLQGICSMRQGELEDDDGRISSMLDMMERSLAAHYVSAFKKVFARAPIVPRDTKTWAV
ncbi:hypothetical protein CYLTODRAFT_459837 [Cylindrobasidium torrendii FP15055 ss-10]|uniref:Uncharacterized protein n=1 Tax=Cylindrobasidium torrendii FP15055 ss-10 TaxID=1314674 RepID=A0A0D7ATY7_9AGAR|nr:hypothetical protein CYLTODRAFT_459837 [Cylindrobasidium torrendii FP15055 ss-10]